jgi:nickel superoxide dismutase
MRKLNLFVLATIFSLSLFHQKSLAHCEIPCGIYEDSLRTALIAEHITTIEKSMKMIEEISNSETPNYNQLVRWVMNKEEHAKKIQDIVSQYFLHQRIKMTETSNEEKYKKYVNQLTYLHELQVYAMKAKQTVDMEYVAKLRSSLKSFEDHYFHTHKH